MLKICHRINTIDQLQKIHPSQGIEVDLHAHGKRLVVNHDAFVDAVDFEEWLLHYRNPFLILNIKEEGIENRVLELVLKYNIDDFFLLDLSFPALIKLVKVKEKRVAIRVSHYESFETAIRIAGEAEWVWLDLFFDELPINKNQYQLLRKYGYKICLVSPELHGRSNQSIIRVQSLLRANQVAVDAVCTKYPDLW